MTYAEKHTDQIFDSRLRQCLSLLTDTTPPHPNHNVTPTHIEPDQYNPWNNSTKKSQAPEDGYINIETCWTLNKEIIKQVTSNWSLFTQLFLSLFLRNLPRPVQSYPGRREGRHTHTDWWQHIADWSSVICSCHLLVLCERTEIHFALIYTETANIRTTALFRLFIQRHTIWNGYHQANFKTVKEKDTWLTLCRRSVQA